VSVLLPACRERGWEPTPTYAPAPARQGHSKLLVVGPGGEQLALPGDIWPERSTCAPAGGPIGFAQITRREANLLLEAWRHPLGAYKRPFGYQAWAMVVDGLPVAVVVSGSAVSCRVHDDLRRDNVVELARIARSDAHPRALRAVLRLWTDYLAQRWTDAYWPIRAAVSYALPGKAGNLYRFDGWTDLGLRKPSGGGGTWSQRPKAVDIADGRKRLFVYRYGSDR
jgi:hypothetical protein